MFRVLNYLTMNSKERFNEKITEMKGEQAKNVMSDAMLGSVAPSLAT